MYDSLARIIPKTWKLILGIPFSDAHADSNLQNYAVTSAGDNSNSSSSSSSVGIIVTTGTGGLTQSCVCSLNAMVICQGCGAFTHEDCLKQKLCVSCITIRWFDRILT